jgi:hypothetical protein
VYFCRFDEVRKKISSFNFVYKIIVAMVTAVLFWMVESYSLTNFLYILIAILFASSWILLWLQIFTTSIGSWKIWALLSTASFFAYLYHRPLWHYLNLTFGIESTEKVFFNLFIGAPIALVLGYVLQIGYDKLLKFMQLK